MAKVFAYKGNIIGGGIGEDIKVTQTGSVLTNADYEILLSRSANDTTETDTVNKASGLTYNPSTNQLKINGTAVLTGVLTMAGTDIKLGTSSSSSNDSADIAWFYGNDQEKSRIWTDQTYTSVVGPNYRVYKEDGTSLYSGKLALHNKSDHLAPISNGTRLASADQQGDYNASLFTFMATSSMTTNKPPEDAHIIHSCWDNSAGWDVQLAIGHSNAIYTRSMSGGTWSAWKKYAHVDSTLPLSGGTLTGNLKIGNTTIYSGGSNGGINSAIFGDDVTLGDCNAGGMLGMKSTGTNCGIRLYNNSGGLIGGFQSTNGTAQWINSSGTAYDLIHSGNYSNYAAYRLRGEPSNTINSTANDTTANWGKQLVSAHWYNTTGLLNHQPTQWFHLLNLTNGGSEVCQIAMISNQMWIRGGNASGWGSNFTPVLTTANQSSITACNRGSFGTIVTKGTGDYLPISGGTITSNLTVDGYLGVHGSIELRGTTNYIDFHINKSTSDYTARIIESSSGKLTAYNSISNSSDERLKKDIEELDDKYLHLLDKIDAKQFRYKKGDKYLFAGFIAQEFEAGLQEVGITDLPVVTPPTEADAYYGLDYSQVTAILWKICQNQEQRIKELESTIK